MSVRQYIITGRVQGVGFRNFTATVARRLGVRGTVRNLSDGSVECVATADAGRLARLEAELRRGPSFSRVEEVSQAELPDTWLNSLPAGFEIT